MVNFCLQHKHQCAGCLKLSSQQLHNSNLIEHDFLTVVFIFVVLWSVCKITQVYKCINVNQCKDSAQGSITFNSQ